MYSLSGFSNKRKNAPNRNNYYPFSLFLLPRKNKLTKPSSRKNSFKSNKSFKSKDSLNENTKNRRSSFMPINPNSSRLSFTVLVQYAREKIKKEYCSPYITRLEENKEFNIVKEDENPIYFCLYKINDIFLNKRSRLTVNFKECDIYYDENEYLIKIFKKYEILYILRYVLAYLYDKDFYAHYSKNEYRYKSHLVIKRFNNIVNNNYSYNENDMSSSSRNRDRGINSKENDLDILFQKDSAPYILKRKSLLYLYEYEKLKTNKIIDNFFHKNPKFFFIKDMPKEKIPNPVPNFICQGFPFYVLIKNYLIKNKYKIYEIEKPKTVEIPKININEEDSFEHSNINIKKKKKNKNEDEDDNSSELTESVNDKFLKEIYSNSSSEEGNNNIYSKTISKRITKRYSMIFNKNNNKVKKVIIEDNDIIDVENLIKNMEKKKTLKTEEKKVNFSLASSPNKKKHSKKTVRIKLGGYQIVTTDNFKLKNLYDEKANYIRRTFSRKLTTNFFIRQMPKKAAPKLLLGNLDNYPLSGKTNNIKSNAFNAFIRNNKYFLTSSGVDKDKDNPVPSLDIKKSNKFLSKIARKKTEYNVRRYIFSKENNKTMLFFDKFNKKKNQKKNYFKDNNYETRYIDYPNMFKSKGKIIKQRKISFSIFHNFAKITFKETSEFLSGIKKSFQNKKHQKKLIKEIISNFGVVHHKRFKSNKTMTNNDFPELKQNRLTTMANSRKYKINNSGNISKHSQISNQKEIYRDCINLNGVFNHKKINL